MINRLNNVHKFSERRVRIVVMILTHGLQRKCASHPKLTPASGPPPLA